MTIAERITNGRTRALVAERLKNGLLLACTNAVISGRETWVYRADVPWVENATSTPLHDITTAAMSYPHDLRGPSPFDRDALIYLNRATLNNMLDNTNNDDLCGRCTLASAKNNKDAVNGILRTMALPQLTVYDEGYLFHAGQRTPNHYRLDLFISNGVALMIDKTLEHIVAMGVS